MDNKSKTELKEIKPTKQDQKTFAIPVNAVLSYDPILSMIEEHLAVTGARQMANNLNQFRRIIQSSMEKQD